MAMTPEPLCGEHKRVRDPEHKRVCDPEQKESATPSKKSLRPSNV